MTEIENNKANGRRFQIFFQNYEISIRNADINNIGCEFSSCSLLSSFFQTFELSSEFDVKTFLYKNYILGVLFSSSGKLYQH